MDSWEIPLFKMYWDEEDIRMVTGIIRRGTFWATGPEIEEFEKQLSEYLNVKYCVTFNSGTSALHAILSSYDIGPGDEVIVPSFTFISTANSPLFVGAKPIFADIEEKTFGLDPDDVRKKITKRTKAIIPVHFAGSPCMIREIQQVANAHGLVLIEDAAEALGASINGRRIGSFGNDTILSFCQNKIITTGEGGAVVTNSDKIYEKLRLVRSHGRAETSNYFSTTLPLDYITLGYNFRLSSIQAALGIAQLSKIEKIISLRQKISDNLTKKLSEIEDISIPKVLSEYRHVFQLYPVIVRKGKATRDQLQKYLAHKGIMTKVYFDPVHLSDFYRNTFGYQGGELPITERVSESILALPMYPTLSKQETDYISQCIQEFFSNHN